MKHLTILGSTGSIGRNTLAVVKMFPERFSVKALTAKSNIGILADQIRLFQPDIAVVFHEKDALKLKQHLPKTHRTEIIYGVDGYIAAAAYDEVDTVVSAMVGSAGLVPTLEAISAGKHVALANKETLVMAGDIVMELAKTKHAGIRPVDSEHSAIFQCIVGARKEDLKKIILTASGGPFRKLSSDEFPAITPSKALAHPTWQMGEKISIDSATLMNKGLEVIEAKHLFDVSHDHIDVVIHPQSIIHSMVAFKDGAVLAQMGHPDMKGAIAYALSYPERLDIELPVLDFSAIGALTFEPPDVNRFPCLSLAYRACETGGTLPCVLNAANEAAVSAFLTARISFNRIPEVIDHVMNRHTVVYHPILGDILAADEWARMVANEWILHHIN
ncbi:MAG: 1-deoxy-D-xylulose-5-phosphate reductoisomerase [Desulfobacterales bacterium]|jgi:1-deoxy-D-xylulose-5-phosphate reductoisomerase|nr:1-deoxy-D-xylulose-5-phosphate reductoisomerase [Desulfobacterales bacterium]